MTARGGGRTLVKLIFGTPRTACTSFAHAHVYHPLCCLSPKDYSLSTKTDKHWVEKLLFIFWLAVYISDDKMKV